MRWRSKALTQSDDFLGGLLSQLFRCQRELLPPQLRGLVPTGTTGFGSVAPAAHVFAINDYCH
jgi:hypothetical protein